jgi:hypothetical protein
MGVVEYSLRGRGYSSRTATGSSLRITLAGVFIRPQRRTPSRPGACLRPQPRF